MWLFTWKSVDLVTWLIRGLQIICFRICEIFTFLCWIVGQFSTNLCFPKLCFSMNSWSMLVVGSSKQAKKWYIFLFPSDFLWNMLVVSILETFLSEIHSQLQSILRRGLRHTTEFLANLWPPQGVAVREVLPSTRTGVAVREVLSSTRTGVAIHEVWPSTRCRLLDKTLGEVLDLWHLSHRGS